MTNPFSISPSGGQKSAIATLTTLELSLANMGMILWPLKPILYFGWTHDSFTYLKQGLWLVQETWHGYANKSKPEISCGRYFYRELNSLAGFEHLTSNTRNLVESGNIAFFSSVAILFFHLGSTPPKECWTVCKERSSLRHLPEQARMYSCYDFTYSPTLLGPIEHSNLRIDPFLCPLEHKPVGFIRSGSWV